MEFTIIDAIPRYFHKTKERSHQTALFILFDFIRFICGRRGTRRRRVRQIRRRGSHLHHGIHRRHRHGH